MATTASSKPTLKQGWQGHNYGTMLVYHYPLQNQYPQYPPQAQQSYVTQHKNHKFHNLNNYNFHQTNFLQGLPSTCTTHSKPNNKVAQPTYNVELQNFPTYMITPLDLNDIHLRSGKVFRQYYPIIIEESIRGGNS
jgi:hypothetical protein